MTAGPCARDDRNRAEPAAETTDTWTGELRAGRAGSCREETTLFRLDTPSRYAAAILFVLAGAALPGCAYLPTAPASGYLGQRFDDLLDVGDFGITLSYIPGIALYKAFPPILSIGFGYVNGCFLGLGGGKVGLMRHRQRNLGLILYGHEEVGFGDFDEDDSATYNRNSTGPLGLLLLDPPGPDRFASCVHYLHLGFVGVVASARWYQMIDFALGWLLIDIGFDDGRDCGQWFAKSPFGVGSPN